MTTFATIDIANLIVAFHATEEAADAAGDARDHFVATCAEDLTDLSGPVLVALYLQFRNWTWGDWATAFDVNPVAGLIIWMMVLLYAAGWMLIGLRTRLDTYVSLLEAALQKR